MIRFDVILWDDASDPGGNIQHIAAHGITPEDVESVLRNPNAREGVSRSSSRKLASGWTPTGRHILVVYVVRQTRSTIGIYPVTAYPVDPH